MTSPADADLPDSTSPASSVHRSRAVIDLASRTAALTLSTGGSCAEATAAALQVADSYGVGSVHVDVSFSSVLVSHHRGADRDAHTVMRTVAQRAPDYARLTGLQALLDRLDSLDIFQARQEFDEIVATPRAYRRRVTIVAAAVLGLGVALLLGGGWREIVLAMAATAAVDVVHTSLIRRGLPEFFAQIAGAAIPTVLAVVVSNLGEAGIGIFAGISTSTVVTAGVVALLAGLSVVAAAQDAIEGFLITASARTFHGALMTIGIVMGILAVLWTADLFDVATVLNPPLDVSQNPGLTCLAAVIIAIGFALSAQTKLSAVVWCAILGFVGWGIVLLAQEIGIGYATAIGLGATAVAMVAQFIARIVRIATVGLITAGVVVLLPGSKVYRGLYGLARVRSLLEAGPAVMELIGAASVGLAIAMGVSLGTWLGRLFRRRTPQGTSEPNRESYEDQARLHAARGSDD